LLTPEIVLIVVAVLIYVGGALFRAQGVWGSLALGAIVVSAAALAGSSGTGASSGPLAIDALAVYVRWLALVVGALFVLLASRPLAGPGTPEYLGSLLLAIAGVMLVAGSGDLVLLFLGLELVSIPTYILLYLGRRDVLSQEATVKYFLLSILASAMLLYGFSFLYGAAGSTDLREIHHALAAEKAEGGLAFAKIALVLIFAGLGFKIAAVPFHFYAPDVYQGTTHTNAGLLSVVPKAAGMIALVRVVAMAMEAVPSHPWRIAMALAVLTMTFGNLMALWQWNLRRLLAYSSIAHAGYMLIGLAVYLASKPHAAAGWDGVGALLLYLAVYAVATIGTFAALSCLSRGETQIENVEELTGLGWTQGPRRRLLAWAIALFMFSLAGIPPLAGFWGKLAVFGSALSVGGLDADVRPSWFVVLAVVGVLNAAIAAAYYLRIVGRMFFRQPLATPELERGAGGALAATALCATLVVLIGLCARPCIRWANEASPRNNVDAPDVPQTVARTVQ
jgi:NADH-quinone oxidoreductase subunit N